LLDWWPPKGMVHAYVGQKLVKKYILQVFLMTGYEFLTLLFKIQMQYKTTCPCVILIV
jgi:hypothetical protein